jgi:DNA polymerase III subunit gamma/tau
MSSQVLARKWRPRSFDTLVGQEHVVKALTHALTTDRLHHAYLFTGTRGVGKTTLARLLAKSLNCETGITATPCNQCSACTELDQGRYTDYIEMDAASNRGIAEMTQVLDAAVYAPTSGRYKVYVIDEVHMLTNTAFNAMLKTLEEPPKHIVFILATTDPQKVPVTVLSRCLQFNLKNMPVPYIVQHLTHVLGQENIHFDEAALIHIARAAQGSMRDALSLLDQAIAYGGGKVETDDTMRMLGSTAHEDLFFIVQTVLAGDGAGLVARAEQMQSKAVPFDRALAQLTTLLHKIALAHVVRPEPSAEFDADQVAQLAAQMSAAHVHALYQLCIYGQRDLGLAPDPLSGFTMVLLRLLAFGPGAAATTAVSVPAAHAATLVVPAVKVPVQQRALPAAPAAATDVASAPIAASVATQVAPASTAASVVTPAVLFDGNWPKLAAAVPLSGSARQLAMASELINHSADSFEIRVALKVIADPANVSKLKEALTEYFGRPVRVSVSVGPVVGPTAAALSDANRAKRQQAATEQVAADPFVQSVLKEFGGTVVPGSIQATDDH